MTTGSVARLPDETPHLPPLGASTALRVAGEVRLAGERAGGFGPAAAALTTALHSALGALAVWCYTCRTGPAADGSRGEPVLVAEAGAGELRRLVPATLLSTSLGSEPVGVLAFEPDRLPDPSAARAAGVVSVLALAGTIPDGQFGVLVLSGQPLPDTIATHARPLAAAVRVALARHLETGAHAERDYLAEVERAAHEHAAELERLGEAVEHLRAEAGLVDTLHAVGQRLTAQLDIDRVVQDATDAATLATGAHFGAFFYNLINQYGESYTLYTLSGVPRAAFERFPMPRNTAVFAPTFDGTGTLRSDDIVRDARFGHNAPYYGMPEGHLPVRSYLAVSVISPTSSEVLGGFFFGHPEPGRFTERHEYLAEGIAGYAAIALDNARLFDRERNLTAELSRSMLPSVPDVPGLTVCTRYLPAATGSKVGGDWFDVIPLPGGGTAFVIGDVVGHGVTAAAVMGQVRTAIRSYALLELSPGELLRNVSQLVGALPGPGFVTCFYAVHEPAGDQLVYANAGHLPAALIHPDGTIELVGEALAQPLGLGRGFPEERTAFPPGTDLVLYTDGLVESHSRDLTVGLDALVSALPALRAGPDVDQACDELIDRLTRGNHDDDIAFLHVHRLDGGEAL
ncbi:PP2C family protein-serine/threonine phosphatase [Actinophytocola xanthii]|uniref:PP2C family protein-serine/threonine phosphatase n=1 Tax=Actinophytocola xanthii TaxID=1912961 RepID=UPI0009FAA563|nr:GAF domain-containing SpoIIE family protein phosphatase [Actinophytocola xanthii]